MSADIMKEGTILVRGSAYKIAGFNTGSAMVITACSAQEQVWVISRDTGAMYGRYYSSFSGALLYPSA